jgi:hypothetical protein
MLKIDARKFFLFLLTLPAVCASMRADGWLNSYPCTKRDTKTIYVLLRTGGNMQGEEIFWNFWALKNLTKCLKNQKLKFDKNFKEKQNSKNLPSLEILKFYFKISKIFHPLKFFSFPIFLLISYTSLIKIWKIFVIYLFSPIRMRFYSLSRENEAANKKTFILRKILKEQRRKILLLLFLRNFKEKFLNE